MEHRVCGDSLCLSLCPCPGLVNKILAEGVLFDRLLVGKKDTKTFFITNPGLLPIKWRLTGVEGLPKEFAVFPSAGEGMAAMV